MLRGIKLDGKKEMSLSDEVVDVSDVSKVYIPLMNGNTHCECIVKKGKKVKKGTVIGIRKDIDFPILSSVSGTDCIIFNANHFSYYGVYNYLSGNTAKVSNGQAIFTSLSGEKDDSPNQTTSPNCKNGYTFDSTLKKCKKN